MNSSSLRILCLTFFSLSLFITLHAQESDSNSSETSSIIKQVQRELLEKAEELMKPKFAAIENRETAEWNEEEGDEGNMAYDKAVSKEEGEDDIVYRYLELLKERESDDLTELAQNIAKISQLIQELENEKRSAIDPKGKCHTNVGSDNSYDDEILDIASAMKKLMQWNQ